MLKRVKESFPDVDVVVGNIATAEAALALVEAGADAVKVGIGPGSICTTRVMAGVGSPAHGGHDCSAAIGDSGVPVIADGGIQFTGDGEGLSGPIASTVMVGLCSSAWRKAPGETIIYEGRQFKTYQCRSIEAMQHGSKDR
ncbi:MAG: IMP dehydrogenase [Flavobacteriales bacterium]